MGRANGCYDFQNVFTTLRPLRKLPTALTSAQLDRGTANHNTHPHLCSELPIRERETEGEPEQRERESLSAPSSPFTLQLSVLGQRSNKLKEHQWQQLTETHSHACTAHAHAHGYTQTPQPFLDAHTARPSTLAPPPLTEWASVPDKGAITEHYRRPRVQRRQSVIRCSVQQKLIKFFALRVIISFMNKITKDSPYAWKSLCKWPTVNEVTNGHSFPFVFPLFFLGHRNDPFRKLPQIPHDSRVWGSKTKTNSIRKCRHQTPCTHHRGRGLF